MVEEMLKEDKGTGCNLPQTDPFAKEIMRHVKKHRPIKCRGQNWVRCYNSTCKVDPQILKAVKDIQCTYRDIIYINDNSLKLGPKMILKGDTEYTLRRSDHVEIRCNGSVNQNKITWGGHATGLRLMPVKTPPPGRERTHNVFIFGFDSISRNGFIRDMPKSYAFIKNELKATILNGYNILGEGTVSALFPILTGKTVMELPDSRKSFKNTANCDVWPFIFYKLNDDGYRTVFFEDMPSIGTFQYRFNGFLKQPTDHYLRSFMLEEDKFNKKNFGFKKHPFCVGDTLQTQLMMNLTYQFLQLDGKKFAFTFISDITHDKNIVDIADEPVVEFLKLLKQRRLLNNTLVMIMGDHGPRFSSDNYDLRKTLQGKQEQRLPLMAIRLPDEMITQRPNAQSALEMNADVLTTPHDIYATILDAVDMREHWIDFKVKGADLPRGLTLLEPIPKNRSCSEADISPFWCNCLNWKHVLKGDPMYQRTSIAVIKHINTVTKFIRKQCAIRTLKSIEWVMKKNRKNKTVSLNKIDLEVYQIRIFAGPGHAGYEAAVVHIIKQDRLIVNPREFSRINAYKNEPACISKKYPQLNEYCYCL